jgi:hypothetical protein
MLAEDVGAVSGADTHYEALFAELTDTRSVCHRRC